MGIGFTWSRYFQFFSSSVRACSDTVCHLAFHWQTWLNNGSDHIVWQLGWHFWWSVKHVYSYQPSPSASWLQDIYCLFCKQLTGIAPGCCYSYYSSLCPHIQHVQTYSWKHHLGWKGNRQNDGVSLRQHCISRWWRQLQGLYLPDHCHLYCSLSQKWSNQDSQAHQGKVWKCE